MQIMRLPITIKMPSFQKNVTIKEIVLHKSASTIIPALCLTFSRTRIFTPTIKTNLHRHYLCLHTLLYLFFHYRQIISPFLKSPTRLPTKSPTFIVGNQPTIKR